ncbi:5-methyltetrahydrofolate--homocysteine methyltransferase [Gordonibacter pamelaeae]|uniref:homocysteine S-methyltransferase family protein n=1 Tax=Gordonibacter TaxID=644652 RepID=UPI00207F0273|nr:homocysteine S-methyltransferase family protein [Gordonibacter sp. RACS_AR68]MDN4469441.1 homocysteine S-methyltransferase family protein [Gordonibacter sp. RACS_AR68]GKG89555.1 5-methyltetrahydrofolate--homocysteine methyltransferase [Gordonibacter pamelaeae]
MDENKPAASAPARSGAGRAAGATARTAVSAPAGLPDPLAGLRIADAHLGRVLRGQDFLVQDGAMGTLLQERGLTAHGELPDLLNLHDPDAVVDIHAGYVRAGAEMITTNTFGANAHKLEGRATVADVYRAAAANARAAGARYVAGGLGPIGVLLEPLGTLPFEAAYQIFAEQVRAVVEAGCDIVLIETMTDLREAKAAVLAAKDFSDLPIFASMTFGEDGRTFLGTPPGVAAAVLSSLGAHVVGVNCSLGPKELEPVARELVRCARCPVVVRPNAGLPHVVEGRTVYDVEPAEFAAVMERIVEAGASVVGGCCGTNPAFTAELAALVAGRTPVPRTPPSAFTVTSAQEAVELSEGRADAVVIGERINPTGKPKLKAALRAGDYDYLVGEAVAQQEAGAAILDVNVGLPELDEPAVLAAAVGRLQATVTAPLQVDSSDPAAIEAAVRGYAGKPLVNSVNGKRENLDAVLPVVARYGCAVVGLTLDEDGIPPTAEGRLAVAERIVAAAEAHGIPRCDVAIDCLVMAAATNQDEVREILRAVRLVKERLGVRTVLGVSNVSFGLPQRGLVNATFLAAALAAGLDLPILNPLNARCRDTVEAWRVLNGQDRGAAAYVERYAGAPDPYAVRGAYEAPGGVADAGAAAPEGGRSPVAGPDGAAGMPVPPALADAAEEVRAMERLILTGRATPMAAATERLLEGHDALDVIDGVFIPALDAVGERFERGEFFLPQLMASAEAVKAGFDVVRSRQGEAAPTDDGKAIVLATVQGDIHDIGKNIVRMLLENYGYRVIDLGRDVAPERVVQAVREHGAQLVGLSALMTTTVKAMEQTIALLHEQVPGTAVFVGGAVLTADYACEIGADYYGKDAAEAARIAERFFAAHPAI